MFKRITIFIIFITLFYNKICSQEITGLWIGNFKGGGLMMAKPEKISIEINIYNDSLINGISHLYYSRNNYEHYKISGVYNKKDSIIYFKEDISIAIKLGLGASNCLGNYTMKLTRNATIQTLTGYWKDNNRAFLHCPTSGVFLSKKNIGPQINITKKNTCITDIQNLIELSKNEIDSIQFELYDNGIVDGDTVSILMNEDVIISKQKITNYPIKVSVSLIKNNPINKIILIAESLGTIPPCTALLIITTKKKKYEVSLSSNFEKNGAVEFFLKNN